MKPSELPDASHGSARLRFLFDLVLLSLAALLFALSFPNFISRWGFFPIAYVALAPLFVVVHRASWPLIFPYGVYFGFLSYSLYNYWLITFHPLAIFIVPPIYAFYFLLLFPLLKAADSLFPWRGYWLQALLWISYEYLKTRGFLGYPYGIMGSSQYLFLPLIQTASLAGVWGTSFLVVFPSAFLARGLRAGPAELPRFLKRNLKAAFFYGMLFLGAVVYGLFAREDLSGVRNWKIALIQQNVDPWHGGLKAYESSLDISLRLSEQALREAPEMVVWSETAFVPSIYWHTRFRTDAETYALVKRLQDTLSKYPVPFLIGNNDGQIKRDETGREGRVDYNATVLLEGGRISEIYRKLRLVPFTEDFPYQRLLPGIYEWLRRADTHFWEKGDEYTVFQAAGMRFSTPICFEDTFGDLCRGFINHGAEVLVNLTNDSWAHSVVCAMQHMSIAVFRAVENRRSVVRSTNGGISCVIDPNGRITALLEPFQEAYRVVRVPVSTSTSTLYTRAGDWFALGAMSLSLLALAAAVFRTVVRRLARGSALTGRQD